MKTKKVFYGNSKEIHWNGSYEELKTEIFCNNCRYTETTRTMVYFLSINRRNIALETLFSGLTTNELNKIEYMYCYN